MISATQRIEGACLFFYPGSWHYWQQRYGNRRTYGDSPRQLPSTHFFWGVKHERAVRCDDRAVRCARRFPTQHPAFAPKDPPRRGPLPSFFTPLSLPLRLSLSLSVSLLFLPLPLPLPPSPSLSLSLSLSPSKPPGMHRLGGGMSGLSIHPPLNTQKTSLGTLWH